MSTPHDAPVVAAGRVHVTRLYDLAYSVDLRQVEQTARESATRLRLTRAKPRAVFFVEPPVDVALGTSTVEVAGELLEVDVKARIHDFGAVRLGYELTVEAMPWARYVNLVDGMESLLESSSPWDADLARVRELVASAMTRPSEPGLEVDYVFATVRAFEPPLAGEEVLTRLDLVPLLTGDARPVSERARREVLRHVYSYYADDLVAISWARALIVEPGGEPDVADVLGMAHAQLLELRYYNDRLDAELPRMYDRVEEARRRFAGMARRRYASLARSLHALHAEITEVSERIENALVVTEDVYLAKVYDAALEQYRMRDSEAAIDRKLGIIQDTYTALYDEATAARAEILEIAILLLIAVEVVLALFL